MTLQEVRQRGVSRINRLRRVQRIVESDIFALAWASATFWDQKEVIGWIYLGNANLLEKWVDKLKEQDLEEMSLRQLRDRASSVGVQYYARLGKAELIAEILHAERSSRSEDPSHSD